MAVDAPVSPSTPSLLMPSLGEEVALRALALLGKPYRYGGADLDGFDCSGLVFFIHQALGVEVPRTAAEQQRKAARVDRPQLEPGDLLFFHTQRGKRITHVGIYVGEHRFVHAPQPGKPIELRDMDDDYYRKRLVSAGRLLPLS
jgi:cell wall-associated NlpC family hydrolase